MTAGWNAGSVRARALAARRLGVGAARAVAASGSLEPALGRLAGTVYGDGVRGGQGLADAQRAVSARVVWLTRVLAGWLPREGAGMLRVLLGPVEIGNIADHLQRLSGRPVPEAVPLGRLGTAWSRVAGTASLDQVRAVLRASPWGGVGGAGEPIGAHDLVLGLRLILADRVISVVPAARAWASGAAALALARELDGGRELPAPLRPAAARVLGPAAPGVRSAADLARTLPADARWVLPGPGPAQLWRAERAWWVRVERDAERLVRHRTPGPDVVTGAVALLAADAWRVRAALELAARGGSVEGDDDAAA